MASAGVKTAETNSAPSQSGLFSSPEKRSVVLCLALALVTLALYNPVSRHPFVNYDDDRYVTSNFHLNSGLHWETVQWAFTTFYEAMWQPLSWLSHALDCQLFGLNPAGHHYSNLLIHALNAMLVFLVLQAATGFTWRSLMVAALFAVHPLNVEAVAWVAERKTLLSMTFFLLALGAYGRYARKPDALRYVLVAALFACALMAKPMAVTLPAVLLLWDYWPLRRVAGNDGSSQFAVRPIGTLVMEKLPLLALSAGSAILTVKSAKFGSSLGSMKAVPFALRLENAIVSYATYVMKAFWPARLAPMYPHPDSLPVWQVVIAGIFLLAVSVLAFRFHRRYLIAGWLWFLGTLVPMIGLVHVGAIARADRYAYLSFLGLFVMACWSVAEWAKARGIPAQRLAIPALAVTGVLAVVTHHQLGYWADNLTLWSHTIEVTNDNFVAEDNLGGSLIALGRIDEAMVHFRAAAKINPGDAVANLNFATKAQQEGNNSQAINLYSQVLIATPDPALRATAYSNLGAAYLAEKDYNRARTNYAAALQIEPNRAHALVGMGLLTEKAGDYVQAARYFEHAMEVQPTDIGYVLLSRALSSAGHPAEAQAALAEAGRISPDLERAQQMAARLQAQ